MGFKMVFQKKKKINSNPQNLKYKSQVEYIVQEILNLKRFNLIFNEWFCPIINMSSYYLPHTIQSKPRNECRRMSKCQPWYPTYNIYEEDQKMKYTWLLMILEWLINTNQLWPLLKVTPPKHSIHW